MKLEIIVGFEFVSWKTLIVLSQSLLSLKINWANNMYPKQISSSNIVDLL